MTYHASIVIPFFARKLAEVAKGSRGHYQTLLLLALLWSRADPYASAPIVRVSIDDLEGIVSSGSRLRAMRALLVEVGAITWEHGTYTLHKPAVDELDEPARRQFDYAQAQLADAQRMVGPMQHERPKHERQPEVKPSAASDYLAEIGKQRSDVRDVLAKMAGIDPKKMLYSGRGGMPTSVAVNWLTTTRTPWPKFVQLCERVRVDKSDDRPKRIEFLFEDIADKRAYLKRMLVTRDQTAKSETSPITVVSTREDQLLGWLKENAMHVSDAELPALGERMDCPNEVLDNFRAWRLQQETSPTSAT